MQPNQDELKYAQRYHDQFRNGLFVCQNTLCPGYNEEYIAGRIDNRIKQCGCGVYHDHCLATWALRGGGGLKCTRCAVTVATKNVAADHATREKVVQIVSAALGNVPHSQLTRDVTARVCTIARDPRYAVNMASVVTAVRALQRHEAEQEVKLDSNAVLLSVDATLGEAPRLDRDVEALAASIRASFTPIKPRFKIADFLATVVVPDPTAGRRSENRVESLYAFYQAAAARNSQLPASTKKQFKQDIGARIDGNPRFACAQADGNKQRTGYAYAFNGERVVYVKAKNALRGFSGLRIDHGFFQSVGDDADVEDE